MFVSDLNHRRRAGELQPQLGNHMRKEPSEADLREITQAVRRGDRISATQLYLSATEAGLTEAQDFVRALTVAQRESAQ